MNGQIPATTFYVESDLRESAADFSVSMIIGGDFNELLLVEEKKRDLARAHKLVDTFAIAYCNLCDSGYSRVRSTWKSRKTKDNR